MVVSALGRLCAAALALGLLGCFGFRLFFCAWSFRRFVLARILGYRRLARACPGAQLLRPLCSPDGLGRSGAWLF